MIVFDGSGSMWGKLDGERLAKFTHARDALKAALPKLRPDVRLGLASFGHRRQGDCSDVQVIQSPEPAGGGDKVLAALEKLNPRGRGPIAAALKEAAKGLGTGAGPRSLILIHDDPDNCQQDPCAALADIQAAAPGVVVHVIGLGLKREDAGRLECLTRPTKGRLVDAQTAAQATAGIEEAVRLAALNAQPIRPAMPVPPQPQAAVRPAARPAPAPLPGKRAALAAEGPSALRLAAVLAAGAEPLDRPVQWTVTQPGATGAQLFAGTGQDLIVPLAPGPYAIEARDGFVVARQTATVAAKGQTGADLVLGAGIIRLVAAPGREGAPPPDATITLFAAASSNGPPGKPLGVLGSGAAETAVPAGSYVLRIEQGLTRLDRPVTLTAGRVEDVPLAIATGRLVLALAGAGPTVRAPAIFTVSEDDPDAPKGRRELARSAAANPDFALAPGAYYVTVRQGAVETRERIAVVAGETVQRTLTLAGSRLSLASRLTGRPDAADEPVSYRIERLDTVPPEVFRATDRDSDIDLPAGRYRVEARHGLVNARSIREIELKAGEPRSLAIEQQAGTIRLKLSLSSGPVPLDLSWDVRDASGRSIWATVQAEPRITLQAGRYLIRAETRDKRYERSLDLKAGEVVQVEVRE